MANEAANRLGGLLNEATASPDVEKEIRINAVSSQLIRDKTVLVIARWMHTVTNANKVVVLDGSSDFYKRSLCETNIALEKGFNRARNSNN